MKFTFSIDFTVSPNKADVELTGDTGYYQFLVYEGVHEEFVAQLMRNTDKINPLLTQDLHHADILRAKHFSEVNLKYYVQLTSKIIVHLHDLEKYCHGI